MIEVKVARLGVDSAANTYVLVLREAGGGRVLPIWIGQAEAEAIVVELQSVRRERPMTHDLLKHVITGLGAALRRVTITRVEKGTYFATLHLERDGQLVTVDARPSDSIALALRTGATILAAEELLVELADDEDDDEAADTAADDAPSSPPTGGRGSRRPADMSADELKAYLQRLRPEDFGKFTP